ncbi:MAG: alpha-amylase [Oscillospiraceae bacterium]|nr:alpha-amylase [Oscillospiraceae bacterium]
MKCGTRVLCLLLALLLLVGCAPSEGNNDATAAPEESGAVLATEAPEPTEPQEAVKTQQALMQIKQLGESPDDNYRTFYEIFVYSFCDSDGDGIGDLQGVISKLDYLQKLGITGIWFMPIHPSTSYHKYNVSDYYDIDPQYGTMEDFDQLIAECEKRNINVIIDLVVNHTGSEHSWFKEAVSYLQTLPKGTEPSAEECKYLDYYFFSRESAGNASRPVEGTDWYYEGAFDFTMPDLNLGNEAVREEIREIMQFWIDKGVSGFRLDAAKEFYSGKTAMNLEVLSWIQQTATSMKPDCYLVAEVWENFNQITKYYESGITSLFNFAFGNSDGKITKVLQGAGNASVVSTYATALQKADTAYRGMNPDYIDAPFLSNHDVGRIAGFAGRDENKMKMAAAMNIFMGGSVFIYYGEEIGMPGSGNDPSKRAPFYWNTARDNGTTNPPPECELPAEYTLGSLEEQVNDDSSLYNYYRQAIAIRNALPQIARGIPTAEAALNTGCVSAYRKTWNDQQCIILMNIDGNAAAADLSAYTDWTLAASLSAEGSQIVLDGTTLNLPAWGVAVLIPKA